MIEIQNLTFGYSRKSPLFEELNLKASKGSIIGLLGKNGAGKSTLLRIMAGLLSPQKGDISIMGKTPFRRQPAFLQQVYFVPEEFSVPAISINAYVKAAGSLYPNFNPSKMAGILQDFELDGTKNLGKMSYGQKKKFLIAFALSTNCRLLILDEPTNGLDIPSKSRFRKVLAGALSDEQMVVISTHQVKDVENLIDRIVLIDQGKIMFNHSVTDVSQNLAFQTVSDLHNIDCLYNETAPGGFRVLKRKNGMETPLDIELLFNAITNGTKLEIHESDI
ncbi:ABC transporter ATP-binding protein [Marinilabiliaceae bacterium JC017]|nr:ABC transporter ATP-binding protein [Marinilabiliaceae bacterium JC017]